MSAMGGGWRVTGAALAIAVAAAGCGSSQTSTETRSQTSSPTATSSASSPGSSSPLGIIAGCHGSQLAATYARSDGATGHMELTIALRNVSPTACRLDGYPRAALLDAAGRRLPLRLSRGSGFFPDTRGAPRPVVVAPGAVAHFGIGLTTNNEYAHAHVCRTATAAMAATPGGTPHWQRVSLQRAPRISACGSTLTVSPVHA
jgi:Domain of unknown function (DUF4232)